MNDKSYLKQHIVMMRDRPLGRGRRLAGAAAVAGLVLGGLLVSASGRAPAPVAPPAPLSPVAPVAKAAPVSPEAPPAAPTPVAAISPPAPPSPPSPPAPVTTTRVFMVKNDHLVAADADAAAAAADAAGVAVDVARMDAYVAARRAHRALFLSPGDIVMATDGMPGSEVVVTMGPDAAGKNIRTTRRFVLRCRPPEAAGTPDEPGKMDCPGPGGAMALAMIDRAGINATVADSLRAARLHIEASVSLSEAQRRIALAGLDTALREVQQQLDTLR